MNTWECSKANPFTRTLFVAQYVYTSERILKKNMHCLTSTRTAFHALTRSAHIDKCSEFSSPAFISMVLVNKMANDRHRNRNKLYDFSNL